MSLEDELAAIDARIPEAKFRLYDLYERRRRILAKIDAAQRAAADKAKGEEASRLILAISRGKGQSVRHVAAELGCSTAVIYRTLNKLCEKMADDATVRKHGPLPEERDDPRGWNVWHTARYHELVRARTSFGLRSRGPWVLNGTLNLRALMDS
jgi:hypothetical protein